MEMKVSVRDLKNRLSEYLGRVSAGETLVVMRRGKPVAEIRAPRRSRMTLDQRLQQMADAGEVRLPRRTRLDDFEPFRAPGKPASRIILEDRD